VRSGYSCGVIQSECPRPQLLFRTNTLLPAAWRDLGGWFERSLRIGRPPSVVACDRAGNPLPRVDDVRAESVGE
jgi:hypothetical protein